MSSVSSPVREITVAHSPDSDDAFMFYGLATNKVRAPGLKFQPHALRHRDAQPPGAGGCLRCDRNLFPCLSLYSG